MGAPRTQSIPSAGPDSTSLPDHSTRAERCKVPSLGHAWRATDLVPSRGTEVSAPTLVSSRCAASACAVNDSLELDSRMQTSFQNDHSTKCVGCQRRPRCCCARRVDGSRDGLTVARSSKETKDICREAKAQCLPDQVCPTWPNYVRTPQAHAAAKRGALDPPRTELRTRTSHRPSAISRLSELFTRRFS